MDAGKLWQLVKSAVSSWVDDGATSMGAALAYYTVFSIAPLLLLLIALAGFFFGAEAARGEVVAQLGGLIGKEGATAVEGMLKSASDPDDSLIATVVSFVTLLIGATTVFAELQSDLDRIWKAPAAAKPDGLWGVLRTRFLSFGLILGIGFLLIVSLALSAALSALGKWWGGLLGDWAFLLEAVNFVVSFAVITAMFAIVYKVMPSVKIRWHDVWIGAGVTALLFTIGKFLIGLYIGRSSVASGFGAAGSLIVLLVWVYYSTQIFLLGAEFTYVYAHSAGSRVGLAVSAPGTAELGNAGGRVHAAGDEAEPSASSEAGAAGPRAPSARPSEAGGRVTISAARDQAVATIAAALAAGWVLGYVATAVPATGISRRWERKVSHRAGALLRSLRRTQGFFARS